MKGRELKQVMEDLDLTQQQLADELGVARNTINRWANEMEVIPRIAELAIEATKARRDSRRQKVSAVQKNAR